MVATIHLSEKKATVAEKAPKNKSLIHQDIRKVTTFYIISIK